MRPARVREQELHRRGPRNLDHRALDDIEGRLLLVGHLERFDELAAEVVALRLPGQLLLEPDAVGDVPRVQHDAADMAIVAEIGEVGLEVAPLARGVAQPEHELLRLARRLGPGHGGAIVLVHEAQEPVPSRSASPRPSVVVTELLA